MWSGGNTCFEEYGFDMRDGRACPLRIWVKSADQENLSQEKTLSMVNLDFQSLTLEFKNVIITHLR